MSRNTRSRRLLRVVTQIAVVLVLVGGLGFLGLRGIDRLSPNETSDTGAAPSGQLFKPNPTMLVVTDSMGGGVDPNINRYPDIIGEKLGWSVLVDAMGARGFLPTDASNVGVATMVPPFIDQLQYDADNYRADYILVDGGRNDLGKDPERFAVAFDEYMVALRAAYPDAVIVAIVPSYISPVRAALYPPVSEAIKRSAAKVDAYVLDPVAEGWYEGVDLDPLLYTDRVHLNSEGGDYVADKIIEGMRRVGVPIDSAPGQGDR